MAEAGVEFAKVSFTPDRGVSVLREISLRLEPGTTTALLGRSGSGKTTLMRMVNGLVQPTSGVVTVGGRPVQEWDLLRLRRSTGYVIQETGLFPHWTVERNVGLALELAGDDEAAKARVGEMLHLAGLDESLRTRFPWQLSGGQRQRVGLARALAGDPGVLLMDEPFGALDPITRAEMQTTLKDLLGRLHKTVLLVTHDLDEALFLAGRVVFLDGGEVVADLRPEEVLGSSLDYVARYVAAVHRGGAGLIGFLRLHGAEIGRLTFEHLWLTVFAMLLAACVGLPLGVWLTRHERFAKPVIALTNVIQVIPSLALFGLLLPVPWLGEDAARLAILALTGYALLPIVRNTYAGIRSVDPALIDVAEAMGMTGRQRLLKVELPLSASVILAGLRTATVTCVGVATIAAAIGAGGLGELIFRGVASVDNGLVLAGAVPAALLALTADGALGWLEGQLSVRR